MSSSQRPGKAVATSSQRKRVGSGGNVPPAPIVPKGQSRRFWVKVVTKEGKAWCKNHIEASYFSDISIDKVSLAWEFPQETDPLVLTRLNKCPSYRAIRHTLCGPRSMVKWTKHSGKRYHQSIPYAQMLRETQVWLDIVMNYLIPGLHYMDITRTWCSERERGLHGTVIPNTCGYHEDKGVDIEFGPTLNTTERHRRNEVIMAKMYGLEILRHQNGCLASTDMKLGDVERRYPLNAHAKALLGIGLEFHESIDDDIPTNKDRLRTSSNVESESDKEVDSTQAGDEAEGVMLMED
ncbi:hypothetical protein H5410_001967 [Solanum commersonii]|uniref:Uncharacterized protein n=1 Tax=Solanum commersonii TaxID=4109 RepID=A0A9J6B118_SOLCO|nr:hypothetical protein H5410_001967 [Solanum commersonii]